MNEQKIKTKYRSVMLVIIVLFLLNTIFAASIIGNSRGAVEQCDSIKQTISYCTKIPGNYNISVSGNQSNWIKVAPEQFTVTGEEDCVELHVFVTPECYANSGEYDFNININGPDSGVFNYSLNVIQAHLFDFKVTPIYQSSFPCEPSDYNIIVRNTSKFVDEFVLVLEGLDDAWVTYPKTKFVVDPYSTYTGLLRVTSFCDSDANAYPFKLNLFNTKTNTSGFVDLTKVILDYNPIIIDNLSQGNSFVLDSCEEFDKNVSFRVSNISNRNDELTFEILDENYAVVGRDVAFFEQSSIKLDSDSSTTISLIIKERKISESNLIIRVNSKAYTKNYFYPVLLRINDCYNLNLIQRGVGGDEVSNVSCTPNATTLILFENNGSQNLDFNAEFFINDALIESRGIVLTPNTSILEEFNFDASSVPSKSNILIRVDSPFIKKDLEFVYSFENCFDAEMDASIIAVCKQGYLSQKFVVKNQGSRTSNFVVSISSDWINLSEDNFNLESGASKEILLYGGVPNKYADEETLTIKSTDFILSKTIPIITLDNEMCNDIGFVIEPLVDANCCEGRVIPLEVTNKGYFAQNVGLATVLPEWMLLSDSNIFLIPEESKTVYVNLFPPAGTSGDFNARIDLVSDKNIMRIVPFVVHVFGGNCTIPDGFSVDTNSKLSEVDGAKLTEVKFDFVISNDSNEAFVINNIVINDLNAIVLFDSNITLEPNESTTTKIIAWFSGNAPVDKNVTVTIETSSGVIEKTKRISFDGKEEQSFPITGWFGAFLMPVVGIGLFIVIILIAILVLFKAPKKKSKGLKGLK